MRTPPEQSGERSRIQPVLRQRQVDQRLATRLQRRPRLLVHRVTATLRHCPASSPFNYEAAASGDITMSPTSRITVVSIHRWFTRRWEAARDRVVGHGRVAMHELRQGMGG